MEYHHIMMIFQVTKSLVYLTGAVCLAFLFFAVLGEAHKGFEPVAGLALLSLLTTRWSAVKAWRLRERRMVAAHFLLAVSLVSLGLAGLASAQYADLPHKDLQSTSRWVADGAWLSSVSVKV